MEKQTLLRARSAIGRATPLHGDCGLQCDHACCKADDDGKGGVYLFPGEDALIAAPSWGTIVQDAFAPVLKCRSLCPRGDRPLACRIFPLTPTLTENGIWNVRIDVRARPICPLAAGSLRALRPDFVRAVRSAIRIIAEDADGYAFLLRWMRHEQQYHLSPDDLNMR